MSDTKKKLKTEINELVLDGRYIHYSEAISEKKVSKEDIELLKKDEAFQKFKKAYVNLGVNYNRWYSKSASVVAQILPERVGEFKKLYSDEKRTTKDISYINYSISDYLIGLRITRAGQSVVDSFGAFHAKIQQQLAILDSCTGIIDSKLADIEGVLQSELFASELEMAKDMLKKNHVRVSGALAGVTLEIHLKKVCMNHGVIFKKAHPTITDFNEELRKNEMIDVPTWRLIQRLGDIRNLSVHSKEREPKPDEVEDLIRGCEKLIAELF